MIVTGSATREPARLPQGWLLHDGFELPTSPWDLHERRLLVRGVVATSEHAQQVVEALVRGVGLVISITVTGDTRLALLEDLHRMGTLVADSEDPLGLLSADQLQLLELLASGVAMAEAGVELGWSRRTLSRRLAEARATLGVDSTVEALSLVVNRRDSDSR